ncbi:MAG: hypothetical protein ACREC3_15675 [Methyloceanibacter sp.]
MSEIGRFWVGRVFGTNTGNLSVEFTRKGERLEGVLRFRDDDLGPSVYQIEGTFDGTTLQVKGDPTQVAEGVTAGTISVTGVLTPEGQLRGSWTSTIGTGGTFALYPANTPEQQAPSQPEGAPDRLHTATRTLSALRLHVDDVKELIGYLGRDFNQGQVVVTYRDRGNEISRFAHDFSKDLPRDEQLRYFKLVIQEPEARGLNKFVSIELDADGENRVIVQGLQESWVVGKAESIASFLRRHQKGLASTFRRAGLNINSILLVITLVLLPELPLWRRAAFLVSVLLISWAFNALHARYIPNALVSLSTKSAGFWEMAKPQVLSWFIAASAGVAAAVVYGLLKGEPLALPSWFGWL